MAARDRVGFSRADAEHDDAEEKAEIVPAAVVGHRVNRDVRSEQRHQPGEREDEAMPQTGEEAWRVMHDGAGLLGRGAGGLDAAGKVQRDHRGLELKASASAWLG